MPSASVDAVVTDPPYGLGKEPKPRDVLRAWLDGEEFKPGGAGFMGKSWDAFVPSPLVWAECLRVLKPGGHLLAFAGSRTYDWIVMGVRLAGFEVRDQLMWLYGSGFPKSMNVSKAIDRAAGAEREVIGQNPNSAGRKTNITGGRLIGGHTQDRSSRDVITAPATDDARTWEGYGTALKPSHEPIVMARKPLVGTVAANVLEHGTGAINVDGCRIGTGDTLGRASAGWLAGGYVGGDSPKWDSRGTTIEGGRWPANLLHDGSPEVLAGFPESSSTRTAVSDGRSQTGGSVALHDTRSLGSHGPGNSHNDSGSAARFFEAAKFNDDELLFWRATSIVDAWNPRTANTAESPLRPSKEPVASALSRAVTAASLGEIQLSGWRAHSTSATPSELRRLCVSLTETILSFEKRPSHEPPHERHTQSGCRVRIAPTLKGSDITTTTIALWRSGGFVDVATFDITQRNSERGDLGSQPRTKYTAKASRAERELGLADFAPETVGDGRTKANDTAYQRGKTERRNVHPTVKPVAVMRWLVRLVGGKPGSVILDPYSGSGTTGIAAALEGFEFVGCELSPEYAEIARARIAHAREFPAMWEPDYQAPAEVPDEQLDLFA